METNQLIQSLTNDLTPVKSLNSPASRLMTWLLLSLVMVVFFTLLVAPFRPGVLEQLLDSPRFLLELLYGLSVISLLGYAVFTHIIPGIPSPARYPFVLLLVVGSVISIYLYSLWSPSVEVSEIGKRPYCILEVLAYGSLIYGFLFWMLNKGVPVKRGLTGFMSGFVAALLPGLLMQLSCMYEPNHNLFFHILPSLGIGVIGGIVGSFFLRKI